jgi:hypothetical protein
MPKQTIVKGHALIREGWPHDSFGQAYYNTAVSQGKAKCSCGTLSGYLPSTAARQRWHRVHKLEVLAAAIDERLSPPVEVEGKS